MRIFTLTPLFLLFVLCSGCRERNNGNCSNLSIQPPKAVTRDERLFFKNSSNNMTIGFMGDVMLGRQVNKSIRHTNYQHPWGNLRPLLEKNSLNIINLETTLSKSTKKVAKVFNFQSDPQNVQTLVEGHIDVVTLANNHILDFSYEGLFDTLDALESKNIAYVGAGKNKNQAQQPLLIKKENLTIAIFGYTDNEPGWKAGTQTPGTNYLRVGDIERVKQDIAKIKDQADLIIATLHWGPNKRQRPTQKFINFAHQMIDAGIDIIHGHSAHIFQGIEIYKNKIIMYDTGDFIDDYAVDPWLRGDQSFLFHVHIIDGKPTSIELVPVIISRMQVSLATDEQAQDILQKMGELSAEFQTNVTIEKNRGYIKTIDDASCTFVK